MKQLVFVTLAFCAIFAIVKEKLEDCKSMVLPSEAHMDWLKRGIISIVHFGLNTYTDQEWGFGDDNPKLFDPSFGDATDRLTAEARHIELGGDKDFSSAFVEAMIF